MEDWERNEMKPKNQKKRRDKKSRNVMQIPIVSQLPTKRRQKRKATRRKKDKNMLEALEKTDEKNALYVRTKHSLHDCRIFFYILMLLKN